MPLHETSERPLLIFDGECAFCCRWIERWKGMTGEAVRYAPYQQVAAQYPEIAEASFRQSVQLVESGKPVSSGARAVFRTLSFVPGKGWLLRLYERFPLWRALSEAFYGTVARNRVLFSKLTRLFWGNHLLPSSYDVSSWLFCRLLGLVYFVAFVSFGVQVLGLVGSEGVAPAAKFLQQATESIPSAARFWAVPSLYWIAPANGMLIFLCLGGAVMSLAVVAGSVTAPLLFALWLFYLSLVSIGDVFMSFQWDVLLLETGLLAVLFAPVTRKFGLLAYARISGGALFLLNWLLFRLMISSGVVKLSSGDRTWSKLNALSYHFETQPLPTPAGWWFDQLPSAVLKGMTIGMFAVELAVPFFIFLPRRPRIVAAFSIIAFQVLIMLTGNYCFFNLLTLALALLLIDDHFWGKSISTRILSFPQLPGPGRIFRAVRKPAVALLFILSLVPLSRSLGWALIVPGPLNEAFAFIRPLRSINSYGLFAVMTTRRLEIVLEGSNDGFNWEPYEFRYKPGDPKRMPPIVQPHQPRLDWQMWFAALGDYRSNPWLVNLCFRLLEGSEAVEALFQNNPFPDGPPHYLRAAVYDYRFSTWRELRETGAWWQRDRQGLYLRSLSRR